MKDANKELHRDAWSAACANHYPRLRSYAGQLAENGDIAAEVVHNAVSKVLNLVPDPEKVENELNYLLRSVHNAWVDWLKIAGKDKTISIDDPNNTKVIEIEAPASDPSIDNENDEYRLALKFELRRLNKRDKQLLTLYLENHKAQEIAEILHEDVRIIRHDINVVKNRVYKRLITLKEKVKAKAAGSGKH